MSRNKVDIYEVPAASVFASSDLESRLAAGARVLIVGCGEGRTGIGLARSYPASHVVGLDPDDAAISTARRLAAESGVPGRTTFEVRDRDDPFPGGPFDLVLMIESPLDALARAKDSLAPGGTVIIADQRTDQRSAHDHAAKTGFRRVEVLEVEHAMLRFYRMDV